LAHDEILAVAMSEQRCDDRSASRWLAQGGIARRHHGRAACVSRAYSSQSRRTASTERKGKVEESMGEWRLIVLFRLSGAARFRVGPTAHSWQGHNRIKTSCFEQNGSYPFGRVFQPPVLSLPFAYPLP
jgi:hypothetical protein